MATALIVLALMQPSPVAFTTIAQGPQSGVEEPRQVAVRTAAEWTALWKAHDPDNPAPPIDFAKSMAAAVFLGVKPTGGHAVEITRVRLDGPTLVVEYVVRTPSPDALVSQALTLPFQIVSVPRHAGPVEFRQTPAP